VKEDSATTPSNTSTVGTPSQLLDPQSAAIYLGGIEKPLSVLTLSDWRVKNIGPAWIRVGRLCRYRKSDLDEWLASRTSTPEVVR